MKFATAASLGLATAGVANAFGHNSEFTVTTVVTTKLKHGSKIFYTTTSTHTTHKYGKFNKTKKSKKADWPSSGTHKYGKFNKTKHHSTPSGEPVVKDVNAAPGPRSVNSFQLFGLTAGSAVVAGGLLLL